MGNSFTVGHSSPSHAALAPNAPHTNPYGLLKSPPSSKRPLVVIVGGGFAGTTAAIHLTALSDAFDILLIERRDHFAYNVAATRAAVEPSLIDQMFFPYERIQSDRLQVLHGEVVEMTPTKVIVKGHEDTPIGFDYLVIATGATHGFPALTKPLTMGEAKAKLSSIHEAIERSHSITIVGGGATGVQLAGEIATDYSKSKKDITLISAHPWFVGSRYFSDKFQKSIAKQLDKHRVKMIMNDRVLISDDAIEYIKKTNNGWIEGHQIIQTEAGRNVESDLVIFCIGSKLHTDALGNKEIGHPSHFNSNERLKINYYFQVSEYRNVFAIGDIAGVECRKALNAFHQGKAVATNIAALHKKELMIPYIPCSNTPRTVVTIGRRGGVIQLHNFGSEGKILGARMTAFLKSRNLMCDKLFAIFGFKGEQGKLGVKKNNLVDVMEKAYENRMIRSPSFNDRLAKLKALLQIGDEQALSLLLGTEYTPHSPTSTQTPLTHSVSTTQPSSTSNSLSLPIPSLKRDYSDFDPEVEAAKTRATYTDERGEKVFGSNGERLVKSPLTKNYIPERSVSDVNVHFQEDGSEIPPTEQSETNQPQFHSPPTSAITPSGKKIEFVGRFAIEESLSVLPTDPSHLIHEDSEYPMSIAVVDGSSPDGHFRALPRDASATSTASITSSIPSSSSSTSSSSVSSLSSTPSVSTISSVSDDSSVEMLQSRSLSASTAEKLEAAQRREEEDETINFLPTFHDVQAM